MADSPTVFIVDDDQAVRDSLQCLIESSGRDVKAFASAQEFLDAYDHAAPGCLLLDVKMPGMNGLDLQKALKEKEALIPIIFISAHGTAPTAVRALKLGAIDFLIKPFNSVVLLDRIEHAIQADQIRRVEAVKKSRIATLMASLTPRERDVMDLIVEGKSAKSIAAQLGISSKTVDVHRSHIMEKLEIRSVAEMVKMAMIVENDVT